MDKPEGTRWRELKLPNILFNTLKTITFPQGKVIKPDKQLKALLKVDNKEEVTYFNIQKYMNKHFV